MLNNSDFFIAFNALMPSSLKIIALSPVNSQNYSRFNDGGLEPNFTLRKIATGLSLVIV